jgi:hypothetical protein
MKASSRERTAGEPSTSATPCSEPGTSSSRLSGDPVASKSFWASAAKSYGSF